MCSSKFRKLHRKIPLLECRFNKVAVIYPATYLIRDTNIGVSCEVCKTFQNTYFEPILKNICKRLLLYLAKEVEQNFMKQSFLVNKRKD